MAWLNRLEWFHGRPWLRRRGWLCWFLFLGPWSVAPAGACKRGHVLVPQQPVHWCLQAWLCPHTLTMTCALVLAGVAMSSYPNDDLYACLKWLVALQGMQGRRNGAFTLSFRSLLEASLQLLFRVRMYAVWPVYCNKTFPL